MGKDNFYQEEFEKDELVVPEELRKKVELRDKLGQVVRSVGPDMYVGMNQQQLIDTISEQVSRNLGRPSVSKSGSRMQGNATKGNSQEDAKKIEKKFGPKRDYLINKTNLLSRLDTMINLLNLASTRFKFRHEEVFMQVRKGVKQFESWKEEVFLVDAVDKTEKGDELIFVNRQFPVAVFKVSDGWMEQIGEWTDFPYRKELEKLKKKHKSKEQPAMELDVKGKHSLTKTSEGKYVRT